MTNLITEARELCEKARPGPYDVRNDNDGTDYFPFWVISRETDDDGEWFAELHVGDFPTARFFARSRTLIPELCDALEKAEAYNAQLVRELSALARESIEREKVLARLEAEVMAMMEDKP